MIRKERVKVINKKQVRNESYVLLLDASIAEKRESRHSAEFSIMKNERAPRHMTH